MHSSTRSFGFGYGHASYSMLLVMVLICICSTVSPVLAKQKPNLMFVIIETARTTDFAAFGGVPGVSKGIGRFFSKPGSILVSQAHADYPMCNPSRTCILLGRSPDVTGVKTNYLDWKTNPEADTWQNLPRLLKDNGYYTMLGGKVFHRNTNDAQAWSKVFNNDAAIDKTQCQNDRKARRVTLGNGKIAPAMIGCITRTGALPDLNLALKGAAELAKFAKITKNKPQPFAMFIGFNLPHMPIRVNTKYVVPRPWATSRVPQTEPPRNASTYQNSYSFDSPKRAAQGVSASDPERNTIPAYIKGLGAFAGNGALKNYRLSLTQLHMSGLRQTDSATSIILNGIKVIGQLDNTLVVFIADHGFGYGETRLWEKDIPMDIATRVPMFFNVPWLQSPAFQTDRSFFMNTVDLYRTVAGFLNISDVVSPTVEGIDYSGYLSAASAAVRDNTESPPAPSLVGFSQVVRCSRPLECAESLQNTDLVAYTARTKDFRYTAYFSAQNGQVSNFSRENIISEELYDHTSDNQTIFNPSGATYVGHEMYNVAAEFPDVIQSMYTLLIEHFESIPKADPLPFRRRG